VENVKQIVENFDRLWKTLVLGAVAWLILLTTPAMASVHTYPEPNGMMYRSLSHLQDESHRAWQAVFYKRAQLGQPETLHLRLIGFPGVVTLEHSKPLEIESGNKIVAAVDVTPSEFPVAHVGEYDIKPILAQLDVDKPLKVILPIETERVAIAIPSEVALEWWRVASWQPHTP
jgi:hypothetical protein